MDNSAGRNVVRLRVDPDVPDLHWDPRKRGGQPVVGASNVLAKTVASFVDSGEDPSEVSSWYHLTEDQVDQAVRYTRVPPARGVTGRGVPQVDLARVRF